MDKEKLLTATKQKLDVDYASLSYEWRNSDSSWLIENAQLIYVSKEVYNELEHFDFETMKFILNHHSPICAIAQRHIEKYENPTHDSIYEALWDLVDEGINEQLARDENAKVNEDDPKLCTIRDMVTQFPECDFDLIGRKDFIRFTAEEGQHMLRGFPLIIPEERYGFDMQHSAAEILDQMIVGDISFKNGTFYFKVKEPCQEQAESTETQMGGMRMC